MEADEKDARYRASITACSLQAIFSVDSSLTRMKLLMASQSIWSLKQVAARFAFVTILEKFKRLTLRLFNEKFSFKSIVRV